jgi:prepilin-type N-terminal cleavage/methylation domain-containing protein
MNKFKEKGFTLVELLIVIALIAILSVAVLATINPIEQANKANDSTVQNDAAEVMNAYERYYASQQKYPWQIFTGSPAIGAAAAVGLRSDSYGFGICSGASTAAALQAAKATDKAAACSPSDAVPNLLISSSELKDSFAGKNEFQGLFEATPVVQDALWTLKEANANSVYVCYIPKAKANRIDPEKMRCINTTSGVISKVGGTCLSTVTSWDTPVVDGTQAMFRCVPE